MDVRSAKIQLSLSKKLPIPPAAKPHGWANPIVPGDHPDPTILQVGKTFWASATSGEWSPQFPLFRSDDLVQWTPAGSIFPVQPEWADGSFWAPELVHDEVTGMFVVWYVARRRGGSLCIAVATAESAGGPYTDHGPLVGEHDGSIDPCFARDEHGEPYLIWKEDGNSQGLPTPIWAQPLTADLLRLQGEKVQLITNDQPWEEGVVEGPYILRHRGWFYMFYAGNSCCGQACKYAEGVARSLRLLGPWEKFAGNPIIGDNDNWRCPGHGTAVRATEDGRPGQDYLLYHAYPAKGTIYVGREAVLDEITWTADEPDGTPGWPVVNGGRGPDPSTESETVEFRDDFAEPTPGPSWQWPVNTRPEVTIAGGELTLAVPMHSPQGAEQVESAMLAVPSPGRMYYEASVELAVSKPADASLWAGLSIVGDPFNTIGLGVRGATDGGAPLLILWQRRGATQSVIWQSPLAANRWIGLRSQSAGTGHTLQFSYSLDGQDWLMAGDPYDASDLPAWDRGLRIGLMLEGPEGRRATFRLFRLKAH